MYLKLKQILRTLFPRNFLYKNELFFRAIYYQFYRGRKYKCSICNKNLIKFIGTNNDAKICPNCGSSARNRRLWSILEKDFLKEDIKVLHFSPARSLYRKLKSIPFINYSSTDFTGEFLAEKQLDITGISENNDTYDLIICYHVLEHIEDDKKAMAELYRILKPGANCILQTPFKEGEIYENPALKTAEERLLHFGQQDHVRIYTKNGLQARLAKTGFKVDIKEFKEDHDNYFGYKQTETVIIARK